MRAGITLTYHFDELLGDRVWWDIERVFSDDLRWTRPRWSCSMSQRSSKQHPGVIGGPRLETRERASK